MDAYPLGLPKRWVGLYGASPWVGILMNPKQDRFCKEYMIDLNATQAAIRAGYSEKTAQEQGSRLLSNVMVQARLAELRAKLSEKTEVTVIRVVEELALIAFSDIADLLEVTADGRIIVKDLDTLPTGASRTLKSVKENRVTKRSKKGDKSAEEIIYDKVGYEGWDKLRALELLGRHLAMFTDLKLDLGEGVTALIHRIFTDKRPIE